jgi:hypothetical protein
MSLFKNFIFSICAMLICVTNAYAWSSLDTGHAFATHQFINEKAYKAIRKHPAFNSSGFPSLDDIQRHGSVSISSKLSISALGILPKPTIVGLGPDVEGNSYFSQHWYNPANKQGKAPETINKLHADLSEALNQTSGNHSEEKILENNAHLAAYVAHYMQDMTCPMHVSGIDGINALRSEIGNLDDISPYAVYLYSKETWKTMIDLFKEVRDNDPHTDFFDPLYYDGGWPATTNFGSHVQYEAKVEEHYMAVATATHQILWAVEEKKGYVPKDYDNNKAKTISEGMELLAKDAAKKTRERIGTKSNPGPLWIDLDAIYASLQIPYEDWWRAIQLTYVTWRSSFCALHSSTEDIKFVKISNRPKEYKLSVSVDNLEPESPAKIVNVYYKIEGDIKTDGNIDFTESIPKNDTSGWYSADKSFKIEDPKNLSGKIIIEIKGKYDKKIPDSGFKRVQYDLKDITIEAIEMPNVFNHKKDSAAIQSLKADLWAFNVNIESAGVPDSQNMEYRVKSQIPAPGEWVARGDDVILKVYGKFAQDPPAGENNTINKADKTKNDQAKTEKLCNETKNAANALFVKIEDNEKKFVSFGDKLKNFFKKLKGLKKESKFIKTAHKDFEKKTADIAEISHELEKLTLKLCETTKGLNDHTKTDSEHDQNYDWINNKKERLKEHIDTAKNILKEAESLDKESKKRLGAVKLLKDTSQAAFKEISKDIEALLETNLGRSMDELNQKAVMINTDDCPEDVFATLREATKRYQKNKDKLKQITAFYKSIKIDFDEKVEEVENLEQIYQKTAYLLDLSKAYVERAQNAAVKGAFCAVLAEDTMKRVFIPDVRGSQIGEAESRVRQKGLNVTRSELGLSPLEGKAGMVENILPGITKRVKKGSMVTLSYYDKRPDRATQLANTDCRQWPGSQPVWDTQNNKPGCGCTGDLVWNKDNTRCINRIDAALANATCMYPNSYPVWSYDQNRAECACIPGTVWNQDRSACIDSRQAALNNYNCSQYPGTVPNYDNNGNLGCACPNGTQWIQNMNRCVSQQDIAIANTDCSHKPGSAPTWSYITNQVECECQPPYSPDLMTGKCVDWIAKAQRDNEAFNQRMENDRQEFDQRMAEQRRHDQEQNQQFFNNFMGMIGGFSQPNNQRGNNGNQNDKDSNLCNTQGLDVIGVWDTNTRWHSCLKGVNLSIGVPGKTNGVKPDCPVSNWPPKFQRTRCSSMQGRCAIHVIIQESKEYGSLGYLKKGEEVCGYFY